VLCLDHRQGGGSRERRAAQQNSQQRYRAIIAGGFPKHLQSLCFNCNGEKARYERQQYIEGQRMARSGRKQINPTVSTHTVEYLDKHGAAWGCTQGEALTRVCTEHEQLWKRLDDIYQLLMSMNQALVQARSEPEQPDAHLILPPIDVPTPESSQAEVPREPRAWWPWRR
jgi:hypothetical protein